MTRWEIRWIVSIILCRMPYAVNYGMPYVLWSRERPTSCHTKFELKYGTSESELLHKHVTNVHRIREPAPDPEPDHELQANYLLCILQCHGINEWELPSHGSSIDIIRWNNNLQLVCTSTQLPIWLNMRASLEWYTEIHTLPRCRASSPHSWQLYNFWGHPEQQ